MDAQALATTPIFTVSLVLCALLTVCGFTIFLKNMLSKAALASATRGLMPDEMQSVEYAGSFHNQVEQLLDTLSIVEQLAPEMPMPFRDPSWTRLLEIGNELEVARGELHQLLEARNFSTASKLGSYLSGDAKLMPEFLDISSTIDLHKLHNWQDNSRNLLQRFITRLEDAADSGSAGHHRRPSHTFYDTIRQLKAVLTSEGE